MPPELRLAEENKVLESWLNDALAEVKCLKRWVKILETLLALILTVAIVWGILRAVR